MQQLAVLESWLIGLAARVCLSQINCRMMSVQHNLYSGSSLIQWMQVYRICDVIRGAKSLAIAVGPPPNNVHGISTADLMLQQWGRRIWTFPEVLLSPSGRDIRVYMRGSDLKAPLLVAKNQFAAKVWKDDAHIARQVGNTLLVICDEYADDCS